MLQTIDVTNVYHGDKFLLHLKKPLTRVLHSAVLLHIRHPEYYTSISKMVFYKKLEAFFLLILLISAKLAVTSPLVFLILGIWIFSNFGQSNKSFINFIDLF